MLQTNMFSRCFVHPHLHPLGSPRYLVEFSSNVVPSIKELSDKGHSDLMVFWGLKKMWGAQNCRILWCTITESVIFTVIRCWICSMVQTWISMNTVYIYIFYYYCFHYCYYYHLYFFIICYYVFIFAITCYYLLFCFLFVIMLLFIIIIILLLFIFIYYYVVLFIIMYFFIYYHL